MLLLTERTAALQRTAEPDGSGGCSGGEGGEGGEGGPGEAALVSSEVELVCRGAEWLRHYAELNQVSTPISPSPSP